MPAHLKKGTTIPGATMPVTPQGGFITYQDDRLGIPGDMVDRNPSISDAAFKANACMMDGCSGKMGIDTLYDNIVEGCEIVNPRSKEQGPPDMVVGPDIERPLYPQRK